MVHSGARVQLRWTFKVSAATCDAVWCCVMLCDAIKSVNQASFFCPCLEPCCGWSTQHNAWSLTHTSSLGLSTYCERVSWYNHHPHPEEIHNRPFPQKHPQWVCSSQLWCLSLLSECVLVVEIIYQTFLHREYCAMSCYPQRCFFALPSEGGLVVEILYKTFSTENAAEESACYP